MGGLGKLFRQIKKVMYLGILVLCFCASCDRRDATVVVNSYINAIQEDNKKVAEEYVGTEDKVQFSENYEDIKKNMADATIKVLKVENYNNNLYRVLVFVDSKHPVYASQRYFYLEKQDGKMKIVFPYNVLCKDWEKVEGTYTVCHFSSSSDSAKAGEAVKAMDNYFLVISQFLSKQDLFGKKVDYYLCRDEKELNDVLGFRNKFSQKHAVAMYQKVFSTFPCDSITYIASLLMDKPIFVKYGIYMYSKKGQEYAGYSYDFWITRLPRQPSFKKTFFASGYNTFISNDSYLLPNAHCVSLFGFLMKKLGEEKIKDFVRECTPENAAEELEKITGERLEEIEAEWTKHIAGGETKVTGIDSLFTMHFKIRYSKEFSLLVDKITNTIEDEYKKVCDGLSYFPDENEKITVNFLNNEKFVEKIGISNKGTIQNGEIFINTPVEPSKDISALVAHELTHLFAQSIGKYKTLSQYPPLWFHEGLPRYVGKQKEFIVLEWGNFLSFIPPERLKLPKREEERQDIGFELSVYSAIEFLFENWGKERVNKLLIVLGETGNFETAFRKVIGISTSKFERLWKKEIKKKFWTYT